MSLFERKFADDVKIQSQRTFIVETEVGGLAVDEIIVEKKTPTGNNETIVMFIRSPYTQIRFDGVYSPVVSKSFTSSPIYNRDDDPTMRELAQMRCKEGFIRYWNASDLAQLAMVSDQLLLVESMKETITNVIG